MHSIMILDKYECSASHLPQNSTFNASFLGMNNRIYSVRMYLNDVCLVEVDFLSFLFYFVWPHFIFGIPVGILYTQQRKHPHHHYHHHHTIMSSIISIISIIIAIQNNFQPNFTRFSYFLSFAFFFLL